MHYYIKAGNVFINDNPLPTKIEWSCDGLISELFKNYKQEYTIKNDAVFLGFSYFNLLCRIFQNGNFSIKMFLQNVSSPHLLSVDFENKLSLGTMVLEDRIESYFNVYCKYILNEKSQPRDLMQILSIEDSLKGRNISDLMKTLEDEYDSHDGKKEKIFSDEKARKLATKDLADLDKYLHDIQQKNHAILTDFKAFISGFIDYIKEQKNHEHSRFKYIYNLLHDEFLLFQNSQIDSLKKYKLVIGQNAKKHTEGRGKVESFVPSGSCHYGTHVFINSFPKSKRLRFDLWEKRNILITFFHEIAHAIDYLYFNEKVLKKQESLYKMRPSHNFEFLHCVKLNYAKFKSFKNIIPHKTSNAIDYYCTPKITYVELPRKNPYENDIKDVFKDFMPIDLIYDPINISYNPISSKKFAPCFSVNSMKYDYGRVMQEAWAESFAVIFNWMRNPFTEYDHFIIKSPRSYQRILIKCLYHSLIYVLYNFDWSKLNIPYSRVLKRRVEIRQFLDYVNDMPIEINGRNGRKIKSKKYRNLRDIKNLR